jgi:transposase
MKQQTSAPSETFGEGRKMIDYSDKALFVGIDVHKKDWQVGIICNGILLGNHRMAGKSQELIDFLNKRYHGAAFKCVYESCAWGFNLQRQLTKAGMECIVVHAGDVPGSDKEKKNKTDKVDAARLGRHHAAGLLEGIDVPDEELQKERNLVRFRTRILADLNRSKNRLKSLLKFQGIEIPAAFDNSSWSKNFIHWVEEETAKDALLYDTAELMLEEIKMQRQLLLKTTKKLRLLMQTKKHEPNMKLITSVPGIGPTIATLFLLEAGDIKRFSSFDRLNSFVGFYPGSNSSGEKNLDTGISNRKHNQLRTLLVEAAWQAVRQDPAMLDAYEQLKKRMTGNKAIIRIARKLLRRMRTVLITGVEYQKGIIK